MRLSLHWKIILIVFMPIVGIYLAAMSYNIFKMRQRTTMEVEQQMSDLASSYADRFNSHLREAAKVAEMTAAFVENNPHLTSDQIYAILRSNLQENPLVYGSAVCFEPYKYRPDTRLFVRYVYRDGNALRQIDPTPTGYDYTELKQEYWHRPKSSGEALWTEPYFDEGAGNILMCTYSVPFHRNGIFLGIATVDIPLEPLRELVDIGVSRDIKFSVLTKAGKYVYSPHPEHINKSIFETGKLIKKEDLIRLMRVITSGRTGVEKISGWELDEHEWIFYAPVKFAHWGFAASMTEKQALSAVRAQFYRNLDFLFISLIIITASLWFLSSQISRPISELNYSVSEIAKGNLNVRAEIKRNDEIGGLAGAFDVMASRLAEREEALKDSEKRYRAIVDDAPVFICRFIPGGNITYVNDTYCRFFGKDREELVGKNFFMLIPETDREAVRLNISSLNADAPTRIHEHRIIGFNGEIHWQRWTNRALFDEHGQVTAYQAVGEDITDRITAEERRTDLESQLRQAQKMEAIGTLAGGIAHDFNNILSAIVGYTELTLADVDSGSLAHSNLHQILKAGDRAKDLVQQILTFSRQTDQEFKPVQLQLIIKEALKLLRASLPTTIDIRQSIKSKNLVMGDPVQIHQIMMNLCTNAAHAMEEEGGVMEVTLSDVELDSEFTSAHPDVKPGAYVRLTVSDTGHGMAVNILERIFDPFFTTKEKGEGTGLGLSVVHGIVKSCEGTITAYSEPGKGSTFNIFLPVIETDLKPKHRVDKPIPKGKERILFVDDEQPLVDIGKKILESLEYEVTTRTSSLETLELFKKQPDKFDLVITDMTMPYMAGDRLAKEITAVRPDIPVIMCTGFSTKTAKEDPQWAGVKEVVSKPILKRELAEAVRKVLDAKK